MNDESRPVVARFAKRQPFFLLGTGRCGSTWIYQLLDRHPQVALTNESRFVDLVRFLTEYSGVANTERRTWDLRPRLELHGILNSNYVEPARETVTGLAATLLGSFFERCFPDRDFTHWGDQLPDPHAARAVQDIWPTTRFVLLPRDPRDTFLSYRGWASKPGILERYPHLGEMRVEDFANVWLNLYRSSLDWLSPLHVLRYEDMVADPVTRLAELLEFLELPEHPSVDATAQRPKKFQGHGTASSAERSVGRWKDDLPADEARRITEICAEMLPRFGYEVG